jgi:hypothetical protein
MSSILNKLSDINKNEQNDNLKLAIENKTYLEDMPNNSTANELYRKIVKRNKIDESDSEDSNDEKAVEKFIIMPTNSYKKIFDMIIALYYFLIKCTRI